MKHRSIAKPTKATAVGSGEQRLHLIDGQGIDQPHVGPLLGQCVNAQHLIKARRNLVLDIAKEGSYRGKTDIAGRGAVLTTGLHMIQKSQYQIRIEIFDLEIDWPASPPRRSEPGQQCEAVGVGRDRVGAGIAMPRQMIDEKYGKMRSERGHRTPPWKRSSFTAAMARIKTGVASRYQ